MILELLAREPRTSTATLAAIAALPNPSGRLTAALLTHPGTPASIVADHPSVPPEITHLALTDPHLTTSARRRLLAHRNTVWAALGENADLTTAEVREACGRDPLNRDRARALLRNPATPPELALTARRHLDTHAHSQHGADLYDMIALERGVDLTTLIRDGRAPDSVTATYYRQRALDPALTWVGHLERTIAGTDTPWWLLIAPNTASVAAARAALRGAPRPRIDARRDAIAANPRLPDYIRAHAAANLSDEGLATGYGTGARDTDDPSALAALRSIAHRAGAPVVAETFLLNPHRSAATLESIWAILRTSQDVARTSDWDGAALTLAAHPHCPPALRTQARRAQPARRGRPNRRGALRTLVAHLGQDPHLGALDTAVATFARLRAYADITVPHLAAAAAHLPAWDPTPEQAVALAALEGTFTGTVTELLTVAGTIAR